MANTFWGAKCFITATFSIFVFIVKIAVMKYFGPQNAFAKYIWKVLKIAVMKYAVMKFA